MKIIVIGTGMYVTGRNTDAYGTILPSIIEFQRNHKIKDLEVIFSGRNSSRLLEAKKKVLKAMKISGVKFKTTFCSNKKDYKNILKNEKKLVCAIIAVPDHLHFDVINECLNYNLHTLVVKPFTTKVFDAKKLIAKKVSKNLIGAVEFHKRFDKHNILLKNIYESQKLGDPLYFNVEYSQKKIMPEKIFKSWASRTNILQYLGVHYIDLVYFITKAKPLRVMAMGQKTWLKKKKINTFDSIQCLIEWRTKKNIKFNQTLVVNWVDPNNSSSMSYQKIKFCGTKGNYESDQKNRGIKIISDNNDFQEPNPDFCQTFSLDEKNIYWKGYGIKSITNFLNIVNKNFSTNQKSLKFLNKSTSSFEEALISTAVIEAASKSLKNNFVWKKINL
ncbi:Gfo/Idh/MocA family oxidoreductase [Pelagibacteraceae bacterium]|nr:Gfo/Idh/MocA family oxidoreductase [Pelagibacteraceae bacterium]